MNRLCLLCGRIVHELFPAHAGMNRSLPNAVPRMVPVPRTRGDEPQLAGGPHRAFLFPAHAGMNRRARDAHLHQPLFPAHAGMNRLAAILIPRALSVPRTRGDEP